MAHSTRFSERIATRSPGWTPSAFNPSERLRTVYEKSRAEIGDQRPGPSRRSWTASFPEPARPSKMSKSVETSAMQRVDSILVGFATLSELGSRNLPHRRPPPLGYFGETFRDVPARLG